MACFHSKRSTTHMVFSLRQLQEKCREQHQPNNIAFIYPTNAFDLMSRDGLFKILPLIGCPRRLLIIIKSVHDGMLSTVQYDGETSAEFEVKGVVKQGCVLAPKHFGFFLCYAIQARLQRDNRRSLPSLQIVW